MKCRTTLLVLAAGLALFAVQAALAAAEDPAEKTSDRKVVRIVDGYGREGEKISYLGVNLSEETKNPEGGARVETVIDDSPAEKAGLKRGDIIVGFGDAVVRGPVALTQRIRESKAGDKVRLTVIRDGKKEFVNVEIGERDERRVIVAMPGGREDEFTIEMPDMKKLDLELKRLKEHAEQLKSHEMEMADAEKELRDVYVMPRAGNFGWVWESRRPRLGVELVETTPDLREFLGAKRDAGVLVGKVLAGTPAEKSGVRVGDLIVSVDGEAVEDSRGLIKALTDKEGKTLDLELVRERRTMHLKVTIPEVAKDEPSGPRAHLEEIWEPEPPAPPAPPAPPVPPAPPAPTAPPRHLHGGWIPA